ncbi:MAG TPA: hypothetical protein VF221_05425 [Chloroflexota bacterium]
MEAHDKEDPNRRLFDELHQIRQELHLLREDFEQKGLREELDSRVNELEIEERLRQIQDDIVEGQKPKKRGWFR